MDEHGFLIVLNSDKTIEEYENTEFLKNNYSFYQEFRKTFSDFNPRNYKGISRSPFTAETLSKPKIEKRNFEDYEKPNIKARIRMYQILEKKIECDLINNHYHVNLFDSKEDAFEVYELIDDNNDYEIIEVRRSFFNRNKNTIGFDIGYWNGDPFSLIADTIVIPKWHVANENDNNELKDKLKKLNKSLLFNNPGNAEEFKEYYKSKDWAENDYENSEFSIIQVDRCIDLKLVC